MNKEAKLTTEDKVRQLVKINEKLTALHWIAAQIASEQDINTLYNLITNGFSEITGVAKCGFYLVNEKYDFTEVISRMKEVGDSFWLCQGTKAALRQALKERAEVISIDKHHCQSCHRLCPPITLHICVLYDRSSVSKGLLVAYDLYNQASKHEYLKIMELYTLQVSLALENAILTAKLKKLAITDGLTRLYNRRPFMERLESQVKHNTSFVLLMLDVDDFKSYNDSFGHLSGDYVLQKIAFILASTVSDAGMVFRYGGEEFAVILPGYSLARGIDMAEKIRINIANAVFEYRKVTVSIGLAQFPKHASNAVELLQHADKALYLAKAKGKNIVCQI